MGGYGRCGFAALVLGLGCTIDNPAFDLGSSGTAGGDGGGTDQDDVLEFIDDDETDFGLGIQTDVVWEAGALRLAHPKTSGAFLSRGFDAQEPVVWTALEWLPVAPFAKPLPDGGEAEVGYEYGQVDPARLALVVHADPEGPLGPGQEVADQSGNEHVGVVEDAPIGAVAGVFDRAMDFGDPLSHVVFEGAAVEPGAGGFTWSMWYQGLDCGAFGEDYIANFDGTVDDPGSPSVWLSCSGSSQCAIGRATAGLQILGEPAILCGPPIDDGAWHHLALVKEPGDPARAAFFVDGEIAEERTVSLGGPLDATPTVAFTLGAGIPSDSWPGFGAIDEVAIWLRALGQQEVQWLYWRGVTDVALRVRVCDDPTCSDDPAWLGAQGEDRAVRDRGRGPEPTLRVDLDVPIGPVLQYQVAFSGPDTVPEPALRLVGAEAIRQR